MKPFETDVLMVCYQQAAFVEEAIRSALAQTYQDFRIVAVDDGSTDGTFEILEQYRRRFPDKISVWRHDGRANRGVAESYRLALSKSSAPFIAFLEGDDLWEPQNLEEKIGTLKNNPEAGVVFSSFNTFGDKLPAFYWKLHRALNHCGIPRKRAFDNSPALLYRNNISSFSHFAARRELLNGLNLPDFHENRLDWWVLAHLSLKADFFFIPEKLCRWRIHQGSLSRKKWTKRETAHYSEFLSLLHESLLSDASGKPGLQEESKSLSRRLFHGLRFSAHCFLKNLLAA